jgi:carboxypeptidase C (cathepsin A)
MIFELHDRSRHEFDLKTRHKETRTGRTFMMMRILAVTSLALATVPVMAQRPSQQPGPERRTRTEQAQQQTRTPEQERPAAQAAERGGQAAGLHWDMTEAPPIQTQHEITVDGKTLKYTATAGRLPIKDPAGKIEAEMFFVAYTLDGADPARRPVTFAYNGGPGSASIWLHMGALGPRKVALQPEGWMPEAPYRLMDNSYTPLDKTDLVLVDAIGTGFSRPADVETGRRFWSVRGDIESFGEFIRMYITHYERWSSPLYLLGESYGTTRSAGIAGYLADKGINFNGICLLSMVLNFESLETARINDVPYPLLVPSFTMIAAYHHKLPPNLTQNLERTREEVSQWAMGPYWAALNRGDALSPQEHAAILDKLVQYTGLPRNIVELANLRVDVRTFTQWLLADQKQRVGRLDGRYTSAAPDGYMEPGMFDPASAATQGPFTAVFNDYIRRELNYKTDMPYYTSARESGVFNWSWSAGGFGSGYTDTATALRAAMIKDPYLRVMVMEGYYDLATPFLAADYTMNHMDLTPNLRKNISYATYLSGHMVYLDSKSHAKMKRDYDSFVEATSPK